MCLVLYVNLFNDNDLMITDIFELMYLNLNTNAK